MSFPKGWKKTLKDLFNEDRFISEQEMEWARSYERDFLLKDARFPLNGEIYISKKDVGISYLIHWRAPFTGGKDFILRKGVRVKVEVPEFDSKPIGVYAKPVEYDTLEAEIIPKEDRNNRKYDGYSLFIDTKVLNESFELESA